jgi:AraC-type transcriptional regulator N-terminus
MLCLVLQGAKEVMIGKHRLRYDPASYFIATLELPASGRIVEANPARPYVAVSLALDREGLAALLPDVPVQRGHECTMTSPCASTPSPG